MANKGAHGSQNFTLKNEPNLLCELPTDIDIYSIRSTLKITEGWTQSALASTFYSYRSCINQGLSILHANIMVIIMKFSWMHMICK